MLPPDIPLRINCHQNSKLIWSNGPCQSIGSRGGVQAGMLFHLLFLFYNSDILSWLWDSSGWVSNLEHRTLVSLSDMTPPVFPFTSVFFQELNLTWAYCRYTSLQLWFHPILFLSPFSSRLHVELFFFLLSFVLPALRNPKENLLGIVVFLHDKQADGYLVKILWSLLE